MTDDEQDHSSHDEPSRDLTRRDFVALSVAAGFAAATLPASAAELPVIETNVEVKTPDDSSDKLSDPVKGILANPSAVNSSAAALDPKAQNTSSNRRMP